eukprot:s4631_g1.t1
MLGLWFRLLAAQRGIGTSPSTQVVYDIYTSDLDRYLPTYFDYTQANGPTVRRPLFGNLTKASHRS